MTCIGIDPGKNSILRSELRRMFRLYVAAEMRADTGTEED